MILSKLVFLLVGLACLAAACGQTAMHSILQMVVVVVLDTDNSGTLNLDEMRAVLAESGELDIADQIVNIIHSQVKSIPSYVKNWSVAPPPLDWFSMCFPMDLICLHTLEYLYTSNVLKPCFYFCIKVRGRDS